jgi:hypothetical protein
LKINNQFSHNINSRFIKNSLIITFSTITSQGNPFTNPQLNMQIPTTLLALALANIVVAVPTPLLGLTGPVNALAASVISATAPITSPVFTVAGPTVGGVLNQVVAICESPESW